MSILNTEIGMVVRSKKDGSVGRITAVSTTGITVKFATAEKEIAKSTFERWYEVLTAGTPDYNEAVNSLDGISQQEETLATGGDATQVTEGTDAPKGKKDTAEAKDKPKNSKPAKVEKTEAEKQAEADAKAEADKVKADKKAEANKAKEDEKAEKAKAKEIADKEKADKKAEADKAKAEAKEIADKAKADAKAEKDRIKAEKQAERQANAGKSREPKEVNPAILVFAEKFEEFALAQSAEMVVRVASNYRGLYLGKRNLCEIHIQKKKVRLHVASKTLDAKMLELVKVVPKSFGWSLDAIYGIDSEETFELAKAMLLAGINARAVVAPEVTPAE